VDVNAKSSYLA